MRNGFRGSGRGRAHHRCHRICARSAVGLSSRLQYREHRAANRAVGDSHDARNADGIALWHRGHLLRRAPRCGFGCDGNADRIDARAGVRHCVGAEHGDDCICSQTHRRERSGGRRGRSCSIHHHRIGDLLSRRHHRHLVCASSARNHGRNPGCDRHRAPPAPRCCWEGRWSSSSSF